MKKDGKVIIICAVAVIAVIAIIFAIAKANYVPYYTDKETVKNCKEIIEIVDDYLDMKISAEGANEKIERLYSRIDTKTDVAEAELLFTDLNLLKLKMNSAARNSAATAGKMDDDIKETRNKIATILKIKLR